MFSQLTKTLEDFEVVNPNIRVFQRALLSISYDVHQAFHALYEKLSLILPVDLPNLPGNATQNSAFPSFPNEEKLQEIEELIGKHHLLSLDMGTYLYDLRLEAQNLLLGHLFTHRVAPRQPADSHIVLTTDPEKAPELIRYFETETAWGRLGRNQG